MLHTSNYNVNIPTVVGYRGSFPVYRIVKRVTSSGFNLSTSTSINIPLPETANKTIMHYTGYMISSYAAYMLPYFSDSARTVATYLRTVYSGDGGYIQYVNNGTSWANWALEVTVYYC